MSIERKPGKLAQQILLAPLRAYLERRSNVVVERNDTLGLKPPYLILSNHVNNWDPLFINCYVEEPICFVAAAPLFRNPLLKKILDYTGAIPKTKYINDTSTIRSMLKAKKHHRVIGIFPEGNRSWDGETEPLIYSTAKLVKLLDIPVVTVTIRGGYLIHPRWADRHRKGTLSLSFIKRWDRGELKQDSVEDIYRKLSEALSYSEMEWQTEQRTPYTGEGLANYLERLLFLCPHCKIPGKLHSEDDLFRCGHCGYTVRYTAYGHFEQVTHSLRFPAVHEWRRWQLEQTERTVLDPAWEGIWLEAMQDPAELYLSRDGKPFSLFAKGRLTWHPDMLVFKPANHEEPVEIPFRRMEGLNIHFHHKLDFFYNGQLFRFVLYDPRTSAFKWMTLIQTADRLKSQHVPEVHP